MAKKFKETKFVISLPQVNLEIAMSQACSRALSQFKIDEDGNGPDFERSTDSVEVRFVGVQASAGMSGVSFVFEFEAWIERRRDDE